MIRAIADEIWRYFLLYDKQAFLFSIAMTFFTILIYRARTQKAEKKKRRTLSCVRKIICLMLLFFYIYFVVGITVLSRKSSDIPVVNLKLFSTFQGDFCSRLYLYENLLLFLPFAILLYLLFEKIRKGYFFLLAGIAASLLIEIIQYITRRGFFEVDDLLTNIVGMMIGYIGMWIGHQGIRILQERIGGKKCRGLRDSNDNSQTESAV